TFFGHTHRLQQYADRLEHGRNFDDEFDIINIIFGQVAVPQIDTALKVRCVGGHVVCADPVINAAARTPHCCHDEIAGHDTPHIRPNFHHAPERLVPGHKKVVAIWCSPVFGGVDLLIRAVHADAQHFNQNPAPVWNVFDTRPG